MGKITGFMELERIEEGYKPAAERLKHFREFVIGLEEPQAKLQAARSPVLVIGAGANRKMTARVLRQLICMTWPSTSPDTMIQSPAPNGRSIFSASPDSRSDSVLCRANPSTIARMPEVASTPPIGCLITVSMMPTNATM